VRRVIATLGLQEVLECLPFGVLVADLDGRVDALNRPGTLLLRGSAGRGDLLTEAARDEVAPAVGSMFEALRTQGFAAPATIQLDVGHGVCISGGLSGNVARARDGSPAGFVIVVQDMTAHEEVARRERLDAGRRDIVSEMAHEALNPLAAVLGNLELAAGGEPCACRPTVERARGAALRLQRLMTDILDDSRLERRSVTLRTVPTSIRPIVDEVLQVVEAAAPGGLRFEVDVPADLPLIQGDPDRLQRVVANLVDNAAKYSPEGGRVRIAARRVDGLIELEVADEGMGISAADLPRIFDRHFRPRARIVRRLPGTGLGLSIVKSIVEAHGGWIVVESTPGEGSTFRVRLPIR